MKKFACIFPGQGSQAVGMASPFLQDTLSSEVFFEACEVLDFNMMKLIFHGPVEELTLTANAQPAILTTSYAAWKHLERALDGERPAFMAGHSLGEFSALVAAGAIALQDAVRLVRKRGQLMQSAVPAGVGAMAALIGGDDENVLKLVGDTAGDEILDIANLNAPGQTVISGHSSAVERAVDRSGEFGFKRAVPLQVSAPFHSSLMKPVREEFARELESYRFSEPSCIVIHNVDAKPTGESGSIPDLLARQIDSPVRWVQSIQYMLDNGVEVFIEVGHGKVLQGLVKKIAGRDWSGAITGIASPEDVDTAMRLLL